MTRPTRDAWTAAYSATARAYWTPERTAALAGGKDLAVLPGEAPDLLRAIGLLNRDGSLPPDRMRKYLQINHLVRMLERPLQAGEGPLRVLDAGCGRSYLSLLLAWTARHRWGRELTVLGVDRNPDVVEACARRAEIAGLEDVAAFRAARLEDVDERADVVLALHACDTATDDAIVLGVRSEAALIAVAPCCQAELARAWSQLPAGGAFAPVHRSGHLRRQLGAHVTDTMRVLLLRAAGYATTALEFVGSEHTQKNTLLRAERADRDPAADDEYAALVAATGGCGIGLAARLGLARA